MHSKYVTGFEFIAKSFHSNLNKIANDCRNYAVELSKEFNPAKNKNENILKINGKIVHKSTVNPKTETNNGYDCITFLAELMESKSQKPSAYQSAIRKTDLEQEKRLKKLDEKAEQKINRVFEKEIAKVGKRTKNKKLARLQSQIV